MRLLLDECVPHRIRPLLTGHDVVTTRWRGWASMRDGLLLQQAAQEFDALITLDRGFQFQQNPQTLPLPIVLLRPRSSRLIHVRPFVPLLLRRLEEPLANEITVITEADLLA